MASAGGSLLSQGAAAAKSLAGQAASTLSPTNLLNTAKTVGNNAIGYGLSKVLGPYPDPASTGSTITAGPTSPPIDYSSYHQCIIYQSNVSGVPEVNQTIVQDSSIIILWLQEEVGFQSTTEWDQPFKDGPAQNADGMVGAVLKAMRVAGVSPMTQSQLRKVWSGVADFNVTMRFSLIAENSYEADILLPLVKLLKLQAPSKPTNDSMGFINPPGPKLRPRDGVSSITGFIGETAKALLFGSVGDGTGVDANGLGVLGNGALAASAVVGTAALQGVNQLLGGRLDGAVETVNTGTNQLVGNTMQDVSNTTKKIEDELEKRFYTKDQITIKIGNFMTFPSVYISEVSPTFNVVLGPNGKPIRCNVDVTFSPLITPLVEDYATILMVPNSKESS